MTDDAEDPPRVLGELDRHEVMDRAFLILAQIFADFVQDHAWVEQTPELRLAADRLGVELAAFYQLAGRLRFEADEPDPLEEIRRVRHEISAEHGHDIEKIGAHYQAKVKEQKP